MEQLVARWAHNPKVVSSSLTPATKKTALIAQSGFFMWTPFYRLFKNINMVIGAYVHSISLSNERAFAGWSWGNVGFDAAI